MLIILNDVEVSKLREALRSHVPGRLELDEWFRATHELHDSAMRIFNCVTSLIKEGADLPTEIAAETGPDGEVHLQKPLEVNCCEWPQAGEQQSA
jgi:hypothetical protein